MSPSQAVQPSVDTSKLPKMMDMSPTSITENVLAVNANCPDERTRTIFKSLVTHLHAFVRETSLTTDEWMTAIQFLTQTGKTSTEDRLEFILLSDTLGVSSLIDAMNNAKPKEATEATVLGPFYSHETHEVPNGGSIASEDKGDYMFVEGRVLDTKGNPVSGAIIDTWETDGFGEYDVQNPNREGPDCRGRLVSAKDGSYSFRAVVPIAYSIPTDGTVVKMLNTLGRHSYRPAHLHVRIEAPDFEELVTALYFEGDPYLTSDAVFGVRSSLIVKTELITDEAKTKARGFVKEKPHVYLKQDFILATPSEGEAARKTLRGVLN